MCLSLIGERHIGRHRDNADAVETNYKDAVRRFSAVVTSTAGRKLTRGRVLSGSVLHHSARGDGPSGTLVFCLPEGAGIVKNEAGTFGWSYARFCQYPMRAGTVASPVATLRVQKAGYEMNSPGAYIVKCATSPALRNFNVTQPLLLDSFWLWDSDRSSALNQVGEEGRRRPHIGRHQARLVTLQRNGAPYGGDSRFRPA